MRPKPSAKTIELHENKSVQELMDLQSTIDPALKAVGGKRQPKSGDNCAINGIARLHLALGFQPKMNGRGLTHMDTKQTPVELSVPLFQGFSRIRCPTSQIWRQKAELAVQSQIDAVKRMCGMPIKRINPLSWHSILTKRF